LRYHLSYSHIIFVKVIFMTIRQAFSKQIALIEKNEIFLVSKWFVLQIILFKRKSIISWCVKTKRQHSNLKNEAYPEVRKTSFLNILYFVFLKIFQYGAAHTPHKQPQNCSSEQTLCPYFLQPTIVFWPLSVITIYAHWNPNISGNAPYWALTWRSHRKVYVFLNLMT